MRDQKYKDGGMTERENKERDSLLMGSINRLTRHLALRKFPGFQKEERVYYSPSPKITLITSLINILEASSINWCHQMQRSTTKHFATLLHYSYREGGVMIRAKESRSCWEITEATEAIMGYLSDSSLDICRTCIRLKNDPWMWVSVGGFGQIIGLLALEPVSINCVWTGFLDTITMEG